MCTVLGTGEFQEGLKEDLAVIEPAQFSSARCSIPRKLGLWAVEQESWGLALLG